MDSTRTLKTIILAVYPEEELGEGGGDRARDDTAMTASAAMPHNVQGNRLESGVIIGEVHHMLLGSMREKPLHCRVGRSQRMSTGATERHSVPTILTGMICVASATDDV